MDASLEEASKISGARNWETIRRVTIPILMPTVLSAFLLATVLTLGNFEIPLLFGQGAGVMVFSLRIYLALLPQSGLPYYGQIAAYGVVMLAFTYVLFYWYARVTRMSARFATVTGKGFRTPRIELGRWQYPILLGIAIYLLVTVLLPIFILIWQSFIPYVSVPSWSLFQKIGTGAGYKLVFDDPLFWKALKNTLILAVSSATIVSVRGGLMAWVVVRAKGTVGKTILDLFASTSIAIPGAIGAFALLIFYLTISRWIPLYGTIWVLILAYSYRVGISYRLQNAALHQIGRELEEASAASGGSPLETFRRVVVPLLAPTMFVTWILIFVVGFQEFTMPLFLGNTNSQPVSVYIYSHVSGHPNEAAAVGVFLASVILVGFMVSRRFFINRLRGAG
jgi:iron(III) transport system permease protein